MEWKESGWSTSVCSGKKKNSYFPSRICTADILNIWNTWDARFICEYESCPSAPSSLQFQWTQALQGWFITRPCINKSQILCKQRLPSTSIATTFNKRLFFFFLIKATVKYSLSLCTRVGRHVWVFLEPDETIPHVGWRCCSWKRSTHTYCSIQAITSSTACMQRGSRAGDSLFNWLLTAGA